MLEWCAIELKSHYLYMTNVMCPMHEPFNLTPSEVASHTNSGVTSRHDIEAGGTAGSHNLSTRASLESGSPYARGELMAMRVVELKRIASKYGLDISACKDKVSVGRWALGVGR